MRKETNNLVEYMSTAKSGDWVFCAWENPSWFNRATCDITGAVHHHDELIGVHDGRYYVGNATIPAFALLALESRLAEVEQGGLRLAIYRRKSLTEEQQHDIKEHIRAWAAIPPKYDKMGVLSIGRSWLRSKLPIPLKPILKHNEHAVYCTESCFINMVLCGEAIYAPIGYQPLPSPIHAERLVWAGWMECVCDAGLHGSVTANRARYAERKEVR